MFADPSTKISRYPSRPQCTWNLKTAPWSDGRAAQDWYGEAVSNWCSFHDLLPDSNSNELMKTPRGRILNSQCYGCAKHFVKSVPKENLSSE